MDPDGGYPTIWFQPVPEGKTVKNRLHLDLYPTGRDRTLPIAERVRLIEARVAELEAAGGRVLRRDPEPVDPDGDDHYFVQMADPEGNEFCLA